MRIGTHVKAILITTEYYLRDLLSKSRERDMLEDIINYFKSQPSQDESYTHPQGNHESPADLITASETKICINIHVQDMAVQCKTNQADILKQLSMLLLERKKRLH